MTGSKAREILLSIVETINDYFSFIFFLCAAGGIIGGLIGWITGAVVLEVIFWRSAFVATALMFGLLKLEQWLLRAEQ
jgi:hypothetical protein